MQKTVIVDMNVDSNIQYQVFVKDIEVATEVAASNVATEVAVSNVATEVAVSNIATEVAVSNIVDEKVITFITEASAKSKIGNLTQNKYQILANELTQELDNHKRLVTDKMASLENSQMVISELKSLIETKDNQITEYEVKSQNYIETIKDLTRKIDALTSQSGSNISELESENDNLNNRNLTLQSTILKMHQERDLHALDANQTKEQYQKTLELLTVKNKELTVIQAENSHFKNQVELYKDSNEKLQTELDIVKVELAERVAQVQEQAPVIPVEVELSPEQLTSVVGSARVQRNVRRANPPRRR
jgi:chromosome segregation ATPase